MTPLWPIRFGNGVRRGSGISTTCYPAPAAIHGSLSSDKERLKLCPRVQTPAPSLGRTSRNRSGHPGCAGGASPRGGDRSPTPQPPTSSNRCGSRRTHPNPVVGITPLRNLVLFWKSLNVEDKNCNLYEIIRNYTKCVMVITHDIHVSYMYHT